MERTHPCRGRCSHNVGGDICRGCGRTVEEVRDWNSYSPEQKKAVMERIREDRKRTNES